MATSSPEQTLSVDQLQNLASKPTHVVERLIDVLNCFTSDDNELRACAADCLQAIEQIPNEVAESVVSLCRNANEAVANWACYALGKAETVNRFQGCLAATLNSSESVLVKQAAALALQKVGRANDETLRALQHATQSSDSRLQRLARTAIEIVG